MTGCGKSTTYLEGKPPVISETYKVPCGETKLLTTGDLEDLTATLIANSQTLKECRDKDNKLIEQVREIEAYYE